MLRVRFDTRLSLSGGACQTTAYPHQSWPRTQESSILEIMLHDADVDIKAMLVGSLDPKQVQTLQLHMYRCTRCQVPSSESKLTLCLMASHDCCS